MAEDPAEPGRAPTCLIQQNVDRREKLMRMGDVVGGEIAEQARLQRIEHADVADGHHQRRPRLVLQQTRHPPARRVAIFGQAAPEPGGRTGRQQRMQARRIARALVEQILQTAADLDREQVDIRVFRRAAEPEPQPVRKCAHPPRTRDFHGRSLRIIRRAGPCAQPCAADERIGVLQPGRGLRPMPHTVAHDRIHGLKASHFCITSPHRMRKILLKIVLYISITLTSSSRYT